jgi:hypothetical protein
MTFSLDKYIDEYIRDAEEDDKKVTLHLKEIIPQTTHLDEKVLNAIIEELKREIENGKDFKAAFYKVGENHILKGDVITAKLPRILTRIILDESNFLEEVARNFSVAMDMDAPLDSIIKPEDIINVVDSGDKKDIAKTFGDTKLHNRREVVFATFDENDMESDPFIDDVLKDIINMLALWDTRLYKEEQPITAVNIRYRNKDDITKRFPVFTDAGWCDKFQPSDTQDNYGRTKSLDPSLKSMPEVVHKNLKLADVIEHIRFLKE